MTSSRHLFLGCSVAAICFAPSLAYAQNSSSQGQDIIVTGRYTIADQIDTATGLGLTIRETPQSVSIMTAQRILDQNLVTVKDVVVNSVGVSANEVDDVRNSFYARGFEIRNTQIDGVPTAWTLAAASGETSMDVSIYERIEIVRGATGLLSGAGDPSASVNLVRKHANATDWTGYAGGSFGSFNTWRLSADMGGAVSSDGRIRVRGVGRYEQGESYIDGQDKEKLVLYGVVEADVTDSTLIRAGISHQRSINDGATWGALPTFYTDGTTTNFKRSQSTSADWTYWNHSNQNIFATLSQQLGDNWSITTNYNRLRNSAQTKLLYLYGNVDKATGAAEFSNPYKSDGVSVQNSFDAQLKGKIPLFGRQHDVVLGALTSTLNRHTDTFATTTPWPTNVVFVGEDGAQMDEPSWSDNAVRSEQERIKQTGYYGALRFDVADPLKLVVGGRLASWKQRGFAWNGPSDYGDDNVFIPYVGALYDITPQHRVYASFTTIFQPQNYVTRDLEQIDPLEGRAYEIGIKSSFLDDQLQASAAIFRIEQNNVAQVDGPPIVVPGGTNIQPYIAAQGVVSQGFELEATGQPIAGWNINASYSQFKAEDGNDRPANTDQPRKLLKIFSTYDFSDGLAGLTIGGGVNYRSKTYSDGVNPVTAAPFRFQQDGYWLANLMARYQLTEKLQLQANIENLFDKTYYSQAGYFSQYRYGAPRTATITANYTW